MIDFEQAKQMFIKRFGGAPDVIACAPGRVNIIGEHTDYNHGYVLPMAIERHTCILARRRPDNMLSAYAANFDQTAEAGMSRRARNPERPWLDYLVGVADEVAKLNLPLAGADVLIIGDVPIGCGLSSSASLEMAALVMFESLGGFKIDGADAPRLGQRVENQFLGLHTGIMDQFISRMAQKDHALFLDCRSFEFSQVPADISSAKFVIANTGVSRGLTASKYNERVYECSQAVAAMGRAGIGDGTHLRDFTLNQLESAKDDMPDNVFRRARHVITENDRTLRACDAMRSGNILRLGQLMNESDESLRCDYEVTCPELDTMTAIARGLTGCYGSRMTGAGFGGCTISLVRTDAVSGFCTRLTDQYFLKTALTGEIIISRPASGAGLM